MNLEEDLIAGGGGKVAEAADSKMGAQPGSATSKVGIAAEAGLSGSVNFGG